MDYYKVLGLEKNASNEDIKRAYRRLAHQYHPDRPGGDEKRFKEINEAYQVLSNQEKRSQYDAFGTAPPFGGGGSPFGQGSPFGFGGGGVDFDSAGFEDFAGVGDIFESIFEGLGVKRRKTYQRGADIELGLKINLEEAYKGVDKELSFKGMVQCEKCGGLGHFPDGGFDKCSICGGQGEIRENQSTFFGNISQVRVCKHCFGSGQIPKKPCSECQKTGRARKQKKISLAVAPGIRDGQIIKIVGAGEAGERGASAGDLYVRVQVIPHPIFKVRGNDLVMEKELDIKGVLKNEKIKITTISGKEMELEIPSGAELNKEFRVSGQGMPKFGAFGRKITSTSGFGDLYIKFIIKKP